MTTTHSVDGLLSALNPIPVDAATTDLDERARTDLAAILASATAADPVVGPRRHGGTSGRRLTLCAAAAVAVALVAAVVVPNVGQHSGVAYAATPGRWSTCRWPPPRTRRRC